MGELEIKNMPLVGSGTDGQKTKFYGDILTENQRFRFTPLIGKKPYLGGWQKNPMTLEDACVHIVNGNATGLGLVHAYSGTCSLDIDNYDKTKELLAEQWIDLDTLLSDVKHFRVHSPKENSEKLFFELDTPLPTIQVKDDDGAMVFELRCIGAQDAFPYSQYQYTDGHFDGEYTHSGSVAMSELPSELRNLWQTEQMKKPKFVTAKGEDVVCEDEVTLAQAEDYAKSFKPSIQGATGDENTFKFFADQHDFGVRHETALNNAREHFNPRCVPPWSESELQEKCRNGYKYAKNPMGSTSVTHIYRQAGVTSEVAVRDEVDSVSGSAVSTIISQPEVDKKSLENAAKLLGKITKKVNGILAGASDAINLEGVMRVADTTFYAPTKSKVFCLNNDDELIVNSMPDFLRIFRELYGSLLDYKMIKQLYIDKGVTQEKELDKLVKKVFAKALDAIHSYLLVNRQRDNLVTEVDLFALKSELKIETDRVIYKTIHHPFTTDVKVEPDDMHAIVADYLQHFPMFEGVLNLLLASRVASDRRQAFYLLQAVSSWGKGFLIGVLKDLGIVVDLSVTEIEKAMTGAPFGKDMKSFLRAWVVVVDEFKSPKGDLKLINSEISFSPKNQLSCTAPVYMKLFTCAEDIDALQGEYGVESQFGNRFAHIAATDETLDSRALFQRYGKAQYRQAVSAYAAEYLNKYVGTLRAMGRHGAAKWGDKTLETYHAAHRIDIGNSLSDGVEQLSKELVALIRDTMTTYTQFSTSSELGRLQQKIQDNTHVIECGEQGDFYFVRSVASIIDGFLNSKATRSEITKISHKRNDIAVAIDHEGKSYKQTRTLPDGSKVKGLLILK